MSVYLGNSGEANMDLDFRWLPGITGVTDGSPPVQGIPIPLRQQNTHLCHWTGPSTPVRQCESLGCVSTQLPTPPLTCPKQVTLAKESNLFKSHFY